MVEQESVMAVSRQLLPEGIIHSHVQGETSYDEVVRHVDGLVELQGDGMGLYEVLVHEFGSFIQMTPEEFHQMSEMAAEQLNRWQTGAVALVGENDLTYTTAQRMANMAGGVSAVRLEVFREEESAFEWVRKHLEADAEKFSDLGEL